MVSISQRPLIGLTCCSNKGPDWGPMPLTNMSTSSFVVIKGELN